MPEAKGTLCVLLGDPSGEWAQLWALWTQLEKGFIVQKTTTPKRQKDNKVRGLGLWLRVQHSLSLQEAPGSFPRAKCYRSS